MSEEAKSPLILDRVVFDRIEFQRSGFPSDKEFAYDIQADISKKQDEEVYRVTLTLNGNKPDEYILLIQLSGFFFFSPVETISDELKKKLVNKNTVSILMPYLRSEVSILTAQPDTECVVLPVFNINKMMENTGE